MGCVDPKNYPYSTVYWTSDATPWSGFGVALCHISSYAAAGETWMDLTRLFMTVAGQSVVSWNEGTREFRKLWKPGTFAYWAKGYELSNMNVEAEQKILAIDLTPEKICSWTDDDPSFKFGTGDVLPPYFVDKDPYVSRLIQAMKRDILNGCPAGRMFGESVSLALISYLYGHYSKTEKEQTISGLSALKLRRLEDFIRVNLASDLTLAQLAGIANLSPRHFCRCFKQATGLPPHRYVLLARIDKAKMMLVDSKYSVTEVATELGFASGSHFSDAFRKVTGVCPARFVIES